MSPTLTDMLPISYRVNKLMVKFAILKIKCNVFLYVEVNFSTSVFNINKSI